MTRQYLVIEDGNLVVNKKECYLIPEFKILFDRDKGNKLDLKGRHQLTACGELKYIYYHNDPRSDYFNTPLTMCHSILLDLSGLPDNWKTDKVFEQAIAKYKELQRLSSAGSAYFSADAALYDLGQDTKEFSDTIRELKQELRIALQTRNKRSKEYTLDELEITTKIMNKLENISKVQDNIISTINKMPKLTQTIKDLREQYAQEDNEDNVMVGGREKGNRED